jgi:hypothetical protein
MTMNRVTFLGTGSDDQALALKMYSGHFVEAWRESTYLWDSSLPVINRKTVDSGKSWQFLQMADVPSPELFVPGDEMIGQGYAVHEGTITVDQYLVAHAFIPRDQMKIAHFEIMPRLAKAHARKIGQHYDKNLFVLAAKQAREAAVTKGGLTVHNGGNRVTRTGGSLTGAFPRSSTGAANFRADLRQLGRQMDEDNIPQDQRWLWLTPYIREVLAYDNTNQVFSSDFVDRSSNDQQSRKITVIEGFKVVGYPNTTSGGGAMPNENITTGLTKYQGNFSVQASDGTPVALSLTSGPDGQAAVGVVTFENVQNFVQYYPEKLGWLVGSYLLVGAGGLDPYCAGSVEIIT